MAQLKNREASTPWLSSPSYNRINNQHICNTHFKDEQYWATKHTNEWQYIIIKDRRSSHVSLPHHIRNIAHDRIWMAIVENVTILPFTEVSYNIDWRVKSKSIQAVFHACDDTVETLLDEKYPISRVGPKSVPCKNQRDYQKI